MTLRVLGDRIAALPAIAAIRDLARIAREPAVMRRAFITALVVGTLLTAINYGGDFMARRITTAQLGRIGLTTLVPYLVSSVSSALTLRSLRRTASDELRITLRPATLTWLRRAATAPRSGTPLAAEELAAALLELAVARMRRP
jgi:hypothetical protein